MVKNDVDDYVNSLDTDQAFTLNAFTNFENEKLISYNGFLSYKDPKKDNEDLNFYRTIDLEKEKFITLEDYFDTDFDLIRVDLEKITGIKLETMPDFQIFDGGITLYQKSTQTDNLQYEHLNYKDLYLISH